MEWKFGARNIMCVCVCVCVCMLEGFLGALVVKNPPANAGDMRDMGLTPGLGRSLGWGMATHSRIFAWRIPWAEKLGGL